MAPYVPEEVDVFTVPHSRMKELVHNYFAMLQSTNFTDGMDLQQLLECLSKTFIEFKIHEQIENRFIMKRLKLKLKRLSIKNTAVCNCHKDNGMTDMIRLLQDGYSKKTEQDRLNYGLQLKKALEDFAKTFLPHMKEEEEVFQPLLLQHFSYEELCELKQNVIQQHLEQEFEKSGLFKKEKDDSTSSSENECCTETDEYESTKNKTKSEASYTRRERQQLHRPPVTTIHDLPEEILTKILHNISIKDLTQCMQVSRLWNRLSLGSTLWRNILPSQWAKGDWRARYEEKEDDSETEDIKIDEDSIKLDDDADIDETLDQAHNIMVQKARNEARILTGLISHILPKVGTNVKSLVLANCRTLTNGMLQRCLTLCPNVEHLDLSQIRITDAGLRSLGKNGCGSKLKSLDLSGCVNVTDATIVRLAMALSNISSLHGKDMVESEDSSTEMSELSVDEISEPSMIDSECLCESYYRVCNVRLNEPCDRYCQPPVEDTVLSSTIQKSNINDSSGANVAQSLSPGPRISRKSVCLKSAVKKCKEKYPKLVERIDSQIDICDHCEEVRKSTPLPDDKKLLSYMPWQHNLQAVDYEHRNEAKRTHETSEASCIHAACSERHNNGELPVESCAPEATMSHLVKSFSMIRYETREEQEIRSKKCCKKKRLKMKLEKLNLSGCFKITDLGLRALAGVGLYPRLWYLDVSGLLHATGPGLGDLVSACPSLKAHNLFYCDNITEGPFSETASGCQNLQCSKRVCCRSGD